MTGPGVRYAQPPSFVMGLLYGLLPAGRILAIGSGEDDGGSASSTQDVYLLDLQAPATSDPVRLVIADAMNSPFEDSIFDGILAKDIVEHTSDPIAMLRELRRITRTGGTLVMTVPQAKPKAVWDDPTHIRGFTANAIESAANASGWQVATIQPIGALRLVTRIGWIRQNFLKIWTMPFMSRMGLNWLAVLVTE